MDGATRERILEATLTCVGRRGMGGLRVEEVAREAGVGRATIYRYFQGGREQLVSETVTWEVGRFFARLAAAIEDAPDFRLRLERGLAFAHRTLQEHEVFQQVLATEPERLVPRLAEMGPILLGVTRAYLVPLLEGEHLRPGVDVQEAADYLARMILSLIDSPGSWDLGDPDQVRELVDTQLLGGVLAR